MTRVSGERLVGAFRQPSSLASCLPPSQPPLFTCSAFMASPPPFFLFAPKKAHEEVHTNPQPSWVWPRCSRGCAATNPYFLGVWSR